VRMRLDELNGRYAHRAGLPPELVTAGPVGSLSSSPPSKPPGKPDTPPIFSEFPPRGSEVTTPEEHDEFVNQLLLNAPDSWDDDSTAEQIALAYVRKLEERLQYLGSTLEKWDASPETGSARPYFVIKCTDELAQPIIRQYELLAGGAGSGERGRAQAAQVRLAYAELRGWQRAHPGEVHFPDHEHVPAVG
jgi:hypothetical protein